MIEILSLVFLGVIIISELGAGAIIKSMDTFDCKSVQDWILIGDLSLRIGG